MAYCHIFKSIVLTKPTPEGSSSDLSEIGMIQPIRIRQMSW